MITARARVALAGAVLPALLLTGCLGGGETGGPEGAASDARALVLQDGASADAAFAAEDAQLERALWSMAGFDSALGGSDAADAAFRGLQQAMSDTVRAHQGDEVVFAPAIASTSALLNGFGGALYASWVMDAYAMRDAAGHAPAPGGDQGTLGDDEIRVAMSTSEGRVSLRGTLNVAKDGVTVKGTTAHELEACPDPTGLVTVTSAVDLGATAGGAQVWVKVHVTTYLQVDDDASLESWAYSYTGETGFSNASGERSLRTSWDAASEEYSSDTTGDVDETFAAEGARLIGIAAGMQAKTAADAAPSAWQVPNRCVRLAVDPSKGPDGLAPGEVVTLTVTPKATDGAPAGGTVTGILSGLQSLDPAGTAVPAAPTATFTYAAATVKGTATASFSARSRRGVAEGSITLSVGNQAWLASGGSTQFVAGMVFLVDSAPICSLTEPFTLESYGRVWTFSPDAADIGTWEQSGSFAGVGWAGGGSYTVTIAPDGSAGSLHVTGTSTINAPTGAVSDDVDAEFQLTHGTC